MGTEEIDHLLLACPYSVEVWSLALRLPGLDDLLLLDMASFWVWGTTSRKRVAKTARRGFDSMVLLVGWELWKERNSRTFDAAARHPTVLLGFIIDEANLWVRAGFRHLTSLLPLLLATSQNNSVN